MIESNLAKVVRIQVDLYGSLSLTGIGHHTDRATILGLLGNKPDTIKIASANKAMRKAIEEGMMSVDGRHEIEFNYKTDMLFHEENLPLHENGMTITALDAHGNQVGFETYYSIGGGFIATADELQNGSATAPVEVEFPILQCRRNVGTGREEWHEPWRHDSEKRTSASGYGSHQSTCRTDLACDDALHGAWFRNRRHLGWRLERDPPCA
ncbi:hypothetical protein FQ332_16535 [Vibrio diabolicus]|nr:hypothetical protein FQ332_16535 [Vibrio diabolicus]